MNKTYIQLFFLCAVMTFLIYFGFIYENKPDWQGMPAKKEPIQKSLQSQGIPFKYKNAFIIPLADYNITGIVISTKRYFFDSVSSISPIDIAVGWKKMSVADVIKELKFNHRRRCLIYAPKQKNHWPILLNEIKTSLSNNHCIPANEQIRKKLLKIRKYDLVAIKGKLVSVEKEGMAPWTSSLSRDDGPGWGKLVGCEIIYVTEIEFLKKDNKNF